MSKKPLRKRPDGTFELQPGEYEDRGSCEHAWQPVSFVFETEMLALDVAGSIRPSVRQPDTKEGRVYCVCMKCATHTYVTTKYAGYYLGGSDREGLPE